jgi:hypothetical protein
VTSAILLAADELPWCEHDRPDDGFGYWCSLRPDVVMCAFCFGAAQAMAAAEDFRCSVCGGPAPDKDRDVTVVVGRPAFSGQLKLMLIHAASCRFRYSSWTSCGVL